jgi:uncharacterized protein
MMFDDLEPSALLLIGGGVLGLLFGALCQASRFCFRQAVGEAIEGQRGAQLNSWLIATLVAIAGTQGLVSIFEIDLGESAYLIKSIPLISIVLGGILFGIGMMLSRGCAGRQVVLAATGNLRSLIVVGTISLSGYMTMRGLFAPLRQNIENLWRLDVESSDVIQSINNGFGIEGSLTREMIIALGLILALVLAGRRLLKREHVGLTLASILIGLLIVGGWYVTGVAGFDEFEPQALQSLSFVAPGGNAMQFLMIYTGATANFGIMLIGGVIVGSFLSAFMRGELLLQSFTNPRETLRYLAGGLLMGSGAVMAIGCSIGQGLSGVSTLSFASLLSLAAIVLGARIGHWFMRRNVVVPHELVAAE